MDKRIPKNPVSFGYVMSREHRKWAVPSLTAVLVATGLSKYGVIVLRNLTDSIAASNIDINAVWLWAVLYPVLYLIMHFCWRVSGFTGMQWFMKMRSTAYQSLYEYLTLHSKDYFNSRFAGALANKIANAVDGTENLYETSLWEFMPVILGLFWYIAFAINSNWLLGLIIASWSLLFLLINIWLSKKLHPYSYKFAESLSTLRGRIVDSLSNISLVQEYAHIAGEQKYIKGFVKKQQDTGIAHWRFSEIVLTINGILIFFFILLMIGASVYLFQNKLISIGVVVMVTAIVTDLASQFLFIGQEMKNAARYYGEAKEGLHEILKEHLIVDSASAVELTATKGEISIESIDFEYDNATVFTDFSVHILAGQKVGLVGRSGAGKTTFVSLLLRHFDVKKGIIAIDGQNIADVTLESLRRAIAFVPQDTSLFHRTIKENISYSNPHATDEEIMRAAKLSQADEFIEKLPKEYETLVGERGVKLSGGQRQRIAIARAFLKNSPILVLDEATSSLDSQSERVIQESLEKLMKGRTVIAIAHRLSTLKEMDRIIVIENGKIIEDGKPEELLKIPNGKFKNMWDHQVSGFIIDE